MKLIFLLLLSTSSLVLSKDFKANVGELKDPFEMNKFEGELIDPFDMETNAKEKLHDIKNLGKNPSGKSSSRKRSSTQENVTEDISFIYLKRIVNLLVHSPSVHGDNFNLKRVKFTLDTDTEDYKFLVAFASSKEVDAEKLRKLDTIISSLVHVPLTDYIADSLLSIQEKIWYMIADVKTLILCGVCVALYMVIHLFRTQHTMWYIIKYFLMFILVADYGQRYHMLLEEAEKQNLKNLSPECRDIGWFQNFFFGKHCENQKKFVTPLDVALSQLQSMIIIPLSSLGSGMGDFGKNLFECREYLQAHLGPGGDTQSNQDANICTGSLPSGVTGSSGDSGGLLAQDGEIIGIVSWGISPCGTVGTPSVFTKVANYIEWIEQTINTQMS